jgi:RNA polymerase sigma factor (TIGR02999 family)
MAGDPALLTMLRDAREGKRQTEDLVPYLYAELRRLAGSLMKRTPPGQTLTPTALVHDAYLRLVDPRAEGWSGRTEFFTAAARSMRDILVEQARRKASIKRGGDRRRSEKDVAEIPIEAPSVDVLALDQALAVLEAEDARKAQIVHLRYFAGLTDAEIAEMLDCSTRTVEREWRFVKAWLRTRLSPESRSE